MKKTALLLISVFFITGCGGTQYRDPASAKGSREWGPKEIQETVDTMVSSLYSYLKEDWNNPALIEIQRIRNNTAEHIDTNMLSNELVTNLMQKRIQFVDRAYTKEALQEMEKGMTGMIDPDSAIPTGQLKSPNLYLYGVISENVRYDGKRRVQYLIVTLTLKEIATGIVRWQDRQEFLKATRTDRITF